MATKADKKKWDDLHAAQAKAHDAVFQYELELGAKYGHNFNRSWLSNAQRAKLEKLREREDKIGEKIFDLVTKISPRDWGRGVPSHWVRRELTWEDAIRPAAEPLSVVVPGSYGYPDGTVRERTRKGASRMSRRMRSRRQPSLPGFPDTPEELELKLPNMPMWEQIGGDMNPGSYGALLARCDSDYIEMLEIQPTREYVGDAEAADVGFPFWSKEASYDLADLDPNKKNVQAALRSSGFDSGEQKDWLEEKATPEQRAIAIAEALFQHGEGTSEAASGWSGDVVPDKVKWMTGQIAGPEYLADEDDEFKNDVLGYDEIRSKLEEIVKQMADESAAQAWSTVGDKAADDAARDGFDPETLIGIAEFGDAVAVGGDLESDKSMSAVEAELERDGYELTGIGGSVPNEESHVSPEHAIRAVAKEMNREEDVVKEAAEGLDWWPKDRYEEIAWSTSGYANVWGKKDRHAHVEDGDYIVQGAWGDDRISESFSMNDEEAAVAAAKKLLRDPTFEGDSVRVITRDGELVWSSEEEGGVSERRRPARRHTTRRSR